MGNLVPTASLVLGSTGKFFMPWFIPRNNNNAVFGPTFLDKISSGRRKRDVPNNQVITESDLQGLYVKLKRIDDCEEKFGDKGTQCRPAAEELEFKRLPDVPWF